MLNGLSDFAARHYQAHRTVRLQSAAVAVIEKGQGAPLLLLHGVPLTSLTWRHNLDALSQFARVIAMDLKGYGASDRPATGYSMDDHAEVVRELIAHLGLPKASIAANSYGCAVSMTLAVKYPELVDRLVLVNPACYSGGPHSAERLSRIAIMRALAKGALSTSFLGFRIVSSRLRAAYHRLPADIEDLSRAYFEMLRRDGGVSCLLETLSNLDEAALESRLTKVRHKALVIWGARDRILPPKEYAHRLRGDMPTADVRLLEDCGHFPHEEMPDEVNRLIKEFLVS